MTKPIKIAIVDDEGLFTEGLVLLFATLPSVKVVASSVSPVLFLEQLAALPPAQFPAIALVDVLMKPIDGFELVEILKKKYPHLKIIILSSHYRSNVLGQMIKLGVSAFLPKSASKDLLIEAIVSVSESGVFFTQRDHQLLLAYVQSKSKKPQFGTDEQLTDREVEVLKLICTEQTNSEIADRLFLSKRTVESHRQRILDKIGAKNTVGLVVYAIAHEIYVPPRRFYSV